MRNGTNEGVEVAHSLEAAIALTEDEEETMIIGGATLYSASLSEANRLYITWIDAEVRGDTHFPKWADEVFQRKSEEFRPKRRQEFIRSDLLYLRADLDSISRNPWRYAQVMA